MDQAAQARRAEGAPDDARPVVSGNPYRVRPAARVDIPALEQIERDAFPTLWPPTQFRRELQKSTALYLTAVRPWAQPETRTPPGPDHPGVLSGLRKAARLLAFSGGGSHDQPLPSEHIAGFVGIWFVGPESHIVVIASRGAERRRGIGELLLIGALEAAMKHGAREVTLEVRASNQAARALYRKYGFRDVGLRKRYYADNNEDAIIMTTPPILSAEYGDRIASLARDHAGRWGESERILA